MLNKDKQSKDKMSERTKAKTHNTCKSSEGKDDKKIEGGWRDILGEVTYSSGPGDNIYVFG
jgi:hypothetical protein